VVNPTVEVKDKLSLVHNEIQAFRKESQSRMENGHKLWQLVIGGLAAVIVLKNDVDLLRFFPLVPVIGMLLLAHYLREYHFYFRDNRYIARLERKINELTGELLLISSITLREERKLRLGARWLYIKITIIISLIYAWFIFWLFRTNQPAAALIPGFRILLILISVFTYEYSLRHLWHIYREIHRDS
jgi:hypothetical protein